MLLQFLNTLINKGHVRSVRAKKNILASFVIRGANIVISFLMVPLTLNYLNTTKYGIWLTLTSFIGWFSFFDIGLGNGLRNKFAEALARGEIKLARIYVSTTYAILGIIIISVFILFVIINPFINWSFVFNAPAEMTKELTILVLFIFAFFCMQFVLNIIGIVLTADQKPAINDLLGLISSILSLIIIFILSKISQGSLFLFGMTFSGTAVLVFFVASIVLYKTRYRIYAPNIKFVHFNYAQNLLKVGAQFFIIQIVVIVMFSTDSIIISHLFGPTEVVPYNIAYKYFAIITMVFSLLTTPFWSAYTEAYAKGDLNWIREINRKLKIAWLFLTALGIVLLSISSFFYKFWIGDNLTIPFLLSFSMFIYVITNSWGSIFVAFINGVGKIRLQLYTAIGAGILNIPLSILFAKTLHLGSAGVIMATTVCISFGPFLAPIQYKKIINNTAKGIWNK